MYIPKLRMFLSMLLFCTPLLALPEDKKLPLQVKSDTVTVNYAEGVTTLVGHVVVTQGSTVLQGDKVVVKTDKNQQLISLIAYGDDQHQAHYETLPTEKSTLFTATANIITYLESERVAIFEGDTHATDGDNTFQGPNFRYWPDKQEVVTEKAGNQQSTITIIPHSSSSL